MYSFHPINCFRCAGWVWNIWSQVFIQCSHANNSYVYKMGTLSSVGDNWERSQTESVHIYTAIDATLDGRYFLRCKAGFIN